MKEIAILSVLTAVAAVLYAFLALRRARRQVAGMAEALEDIRNGNGNRRILADPGEIAAPLVYEINEVVRSYESRLATIRRAEEANRQLMTNLSHDVRTPLTTLIGYLDAAHRTDSGEMTGGYLETARGKAYALKEYIDVLFDWFRLNSGEFTMQTRPVEMGEATRNILIDWVPVLEEKKIDYVVEIPEQAFMARLDPEGYGRILNNLMQNVVTHSQGDCVEIRLSTKEGYVQVAVADNGVGLGEEELKRIFDRLYKCDRGRSGGGSGLGLSIVRQLALEMDGSVTAESTPGKGTTFFVCFPLLLN